MLFHCIPAFDEKLLKNCYLTTNELIKAIAYATALTNSFCKRDPPLHFPLHFLKENFRLA